MLEASIPVAVEQNPLGNSANELNIKLCVAQLEVLEVESRFNPRKGPDPLRHCPAFSSVQFTSVP